MTGTITTDTLRRQSSRSCALFPDTRVQHCRLQVADASDGRLALTGAVLDQATLDRVRQELRPACPGWRSTSRASRCSVPAPALSRSEPISPASTPSRPSWPSRSASCSNGWPLEVLKEEGNWRYVRQTDGYLGWAYATYLAGATDCTFTHLVCAPEARVAH